MLANPPKLELSSQTWLARHCLWYEHSLKAVSEMPAEQCDIFPIVTHPCMPLISKKTLHLPCMSCLKYEFACMMELLSFQRGKLQDSLC